MFERVQEALAKQLRIEKERVIPTAKIKEDLGADSLDVLELLMDIEEEFGITIPDEELVSFEKVDDIVKYIEAHRK